MFTWIAIVAGILALLGLGLLFIYNRLVALRQHCGEAFANIDALLKQRHDLIPNLVETAKGYAAHERGTLDAVVQARNAAIGARGPAARTTAENMLTGTLRRLFALSERYPNLMANVNFQQLQSDLADIESKLALSRRAFNEGARTYNTAIQQFPAALFAVAFGFRPQEYFNPGEGREETSQAPTVDF